MAIDTTTVEVVMPAMGDSVSEGTVLEWRKAEGDSVSADETLVEISTDKVDAEVPAPVDGTVVKVHVAEGDTIHVGAVLAEIAPSNGSGALGLSLVTLDREESSVTVELVMAGLTPGLEHASHIHGFPDDRPSLLPNYRLDADKDGFVEDDEGEPVVAPVVLALTEDGTISNASTGLDFPNADASGAFRLSRTYDFDENDPAQAAIYEELTDRLTGREVQVHGLFVPATEGEGTPGEVNGTAGYKDVLPVANGILLPVTDAEAAQDFAALGKTLEMAVMNPPSPLDWDVVAAQVVANFEATGQWFL